MAIRREYYNSSIGDFLKQDKNIILGQLLINDEFNTSDLQKNSWQREISILKTQLIDYSDGWLAFEFTVPRIGHRIDVVCIINGIIFLIEFKVGDDEYKKSTNDQIMDYALDLKYFHKASQKRYIIPINLSTDAPPVQNSLEIMSDKITSVLLCNNSNLGTNIKQVLGRISSNHIEITDWVNSRYSPTPTIIEAAQALYRNHSVGEISRSDSGAQNLTQTTSTISRIIDDCKKHNRKAICFITGVPGAGKTLAGLNIANERHLFKADEHAVFLSGNGPLVDVLQTALARDRATQTGITIAAAQRETKAFIQIIHKFRDEALTSSKPPIEKVAIFDEAQRAWDKKSLRNFMKRRKGVTGFEQSEPEFLISVLNRHQDWATIVCLVGGGQEIYTGEAGIGEWFNALRVNYPNWDIYLSDKMTDAEYIGKSSLKNLLGGRPYYIEPSLHLGVSLRSFRSENLSALIKALLDNEPTTAKSIYAELNKNYPIVLTRDFTTAKKWVKEKSRGHERYGLLASSSGKRLRSIGIWVVSEINHVNWFLSDKNHVDSSFYLEVAASEFDVQGLEIDYSIIAWDADFRYVAGNFDYYKYRGTRWNHINIEQHQKYLKNAYRVLLTRARQGMVIFIPYGNPDDKSRLPEFYDGTYNYLKNIGITEIDE